MSDILKSASVSAPLEELELPLAAPNISCHLVTIGCQLTGKDGRGSVKKGFNRFSALAKSGVEDYLLGTLLLYPSDTREGAAAPSSPTCFLRSSLQNPMALLHVIRASRYPLYIV